MQLQLDLDARLTERYETIEDVVRAAVEKSTRLKKQIAAECDMSPSELSRRLSPSEDSLPLRASDIVKITDACGESGRDIVLWQVERSLTERRDPARGQGV